MAKVKAAPRDGPRIKRFGSGIYAKFSPRRDSAGLYPWVYYVQYYWNGQRITEQVPADPDGVFRVESARKLRAKREKDRYHPEFLPPAIKAQQEREAAELAARATKAEDDARRPLLFDVASERFIRECAGEYSNPNEVRRLFRNPLAKAFKGTYLDEITRMEIRRYYTDRLDNAGSFKDHPRRVGVRVPQSEIATLSALYTWMQDECGIEIDNPCHRPRSRRKKHGRFKPYRPKHRRVIPDGALRRALFEAAESDTRFRAFVMLCAYTGGRPQSEIGRLCHGDVEIPDRDRVRTMSGARPWAFVQFRDTKTNTDRRLPLHLEAEAAVRTIMLPRPEASEEFEAWSRTPIFHKRRAGRKTDEWDRFSYVRPWAEALQSVAAEHPEVAGMWLRDFRPTVRTVMTNAGVPEPTVRYFMGHSRDVSQGYYEPTDEQLCRAALTLSVDRAPTWDETRPEKWDAVLDAVQGGQSVFCVETGEDESAKLREISNLRGA